MIISLFFLILLLGNMDRSRASILVLGLVGFELFKMMTGAAAISLTQTSPISSQQILRE